MTKIDKNLMKKVQRGLSSKNTFDPLYGTTMMRIVCQKGDKTRIVPKKSEMDLIIQKFHKLSKGEGCGKLASRIKEIYTGPGKNTINNYLKKLKDVQQLKPVFTNVHEPKTITAKAPMIRHQLDLINMSKYPSKSEGVEYKYILSVLDIFSRFLWLVPLISAKAESVSKALGKLYMQWGAPRIIQTDNGSEFRGTTAQLCKTLNIRMIHGRAHHPQSQGKVSTVLKIPMSTDFSIFLTF